MARIEREPRERKARALALEKERKARAIRISKLIERVAKRGEFFQKSQKLDEYPFATPTQSKVGYTKIVGHFIYSVWTETTISYGVGSDDIANFKTQTREFEITEKIKRKKTMFRVSASMQANYEGGPLKLTTNPKDWTWYLLTDVKGGVWEKELRKIATSPARKLTN